MYGAYGPYAQNLAVSALQHGLADSLERVGMNRERLVRAAEMTFASEQLGPREVGALAYTQGLSGPETAILAFGVGREPKPRPSADRIARLATAKPSWWASPVSRVGDLGGGPEGRIIGASLGLDLGRMASTDPLPVPVDARFAAISKLDLGAHWGLGVGIRDAAWIQNLDQGHRDIGAKITALLTQEEWAELESEDEFSLYHQVSVEPWPVLEAPMRFGAGVGMIIPAGSGWLQFSVNAPRNSKLEVRVSHLDGLWRETGRGKRFGVMGLKFYTSSLAEVGPELLRRAPDAAAWKVVSLRFPSNAVAPSQAQAGDYRRLA